MVRDTMSYSRARESVRTALASVGEDPDKYGQHSLRSGGVPVAAAAEVPDRLIQHHGGWKNEAGMKCYFAESLPNLLTVSQNYRLLVLHFYALPACNDGCCMQPKRKYVVQLM